jgi:hypothetical protein
MPSPTTASGGTTIIALREFRSGSLRAFCGVRLPSGLELYEVTIHVQGGRCWASPPARPQLDKDGRPLRDDRGKIRYTAIVGFALPGLRTRWSDSIVAAVRADYPTVLVGDAEYSGETAA